MALERERYRLEVLEPARRAGNVLPADLFTRYGVPNVVPDRAAFEAQVGQVLAYWRELRNKRTYAALATALLAAHAELDKAGALSPQGFARERERTSREQRARLARLAQAEAGAATHVGPLTVARLRAAAGGGVSDAQVRKAITDAGVRVVDTLPRLPVQAPPKYADLARHVNALGLGLCAEAVFGEDVRRGFHLLGHFRLADGRRLDDTALDAASRRLEALPFNDPGKTPTANLLAILRAALGRPGQFEALVLWEILERLRPFVLDKFVQKVIAGQAHELGLAEDDAGILAAAMLAGDTVEAVQRQVAEELAGGRLRAAQRLAAGLPPADPLREKVAEREAEVAALVTRADREEAAGRREHAARLLSEAIALAEDDADLAERLAAVPPPPVRGATARVDGDHVLLTWEPSLTRAGPVRYRVCRGTERAPASPAEGHTVAASVDRCELLDPEAPTGTDLFYGVFASRGGRTWSRAAGTPAVVFTPEVAEPEVTAHDDAVTAAWRAHPSVHSVTVVRGEGRPPRGDEGVRVTASSDGFSDTGLRTGTEYHYRIVACYRSPSGDLRRSAGVTLSAVPAPAPQPVTDLDLRLGEGARPTVVAGWTPAAYGQVRLVLGATAPAVRAGTSVALAEAARIGMAVTGVQRAGRDGRTSVEFAPPPGRHFLTALTVAGGRAVVGGTVEVGLSEPVRDVVAERRHDVVALSWAWPADAVEALVRWPGGERRFTHRVYHDEGAVALTAGPAETAFDVHAVYADGRTAPPARVTVAARPVAVHYRIRRAGPLHPRQRVIEFTAERPARLPEVVVVRTTGNLPPDEAGEGVPVARVEAQPIAPDAPVTATVELPVKGTAWLGCFVAPDAGADGVLLFPPPRKEMRVR
ncbi:hypothetical protein [Actinomadura sp. DC4]|uniref:hypothetical protein n=1 Tax=Actinomadura sp. DC4 TaxID=3055069 RepID=UPI0025B22A3B|nr:hypothetical protein [Actinomadura sp. DC4]MDN3353866.1 hypothetical protein [Actinomadura sp. DC4]